MAFLDYDGLQRNHNGIRQIISSDISTAIQNLIKTRFHVCQSDEYDAQTLVPTLQGELGIIYLVPKSSGGSSDDSPSGTAIVGTATVGTAIVGDGGSGSNSGSSGNSNAIVGTATVGTATVGNESSGSNLPIVGQAIVGSAVIGGTDDSSSGDGTGDDNNIYYEYIYVNDRFEKIGSTDVDLSGYLKESDIASDSSVDTMLAQVFRHK